MKRKICKGYNISLKIKIFYKAELTIHCFSTNGMPRDPTGTHDGKQTIIKICKQPHYVSI